ncbi:LPS export ABC transporter permease LptF [Endothiovibrio diazotrophicus]
MSKKSKVPFFGVIDRFLLRELLLTLSAVVGVLLLILISNRLVHFLADVAAGQLPNDVIFTMLALKGLQYLALLLPMGFYLALLLVLGRMYRDNEMAALAACGVGNPRLLRPVLGAAGLIFLLVLYMTMRLSPWAARTVEDIEREAARSSEVTGVAAGRFKESPSGNRIFYVERMSRDQQEMSNLFIHAVKGGGITSIQSPERATLEVDEATGDRYLVMENGYIYEGTPGSADYRIIRYQRHRVLIEESRLPREGHYDREARSVEELLAAAEPPDVAELQWRFSVALSLLLLALLAVPLARLQPRQGRYGKLGVALLTYLIYTNVLTVARKLVEREGVPTWIGLWWVHLLLGAIVLLAWAVDLGWTRRLWRRARAA